MARSTKEITDRNIYGEEVTWRPISNVPVSGVFACAKMWRRKPLLIYEAVSVNGKVQYSVDGFKIRPTHWTEARKDVPHEKRTEIVVSV
jgi:hypothetical protein